MRANFWSTVPYRLVPSSVRFGSVRVGAGQFVKGVEPGRGNNNFVGTELTGDGVLRVYETADNLPPLPRSAVY